MIAVLKQGATQQQTDFLTEYLQRLGLQIHRYPGNGVTVLGDRKSVV